MTDLWQPRHRSFLLYTCPAPSAGRGYSKRQQPLFIDVTTTTLIDRAIEWYMHQYWYSVHTCSYSTPEDFSSPRLACHCYWVSRLAAFSFSAKNRRNETCSYIAVDIPTTLIFLIFFFSDKEGMGRRWDVLAHKITTLIGQWWYLLAFLVDLTFEDLFVCVWILDRCGRWLVLWHVGWWLTVMFFFFDMLYSVPSCGCNSWCWAHLAVRPWTRFGWVRPDPWW